MKFTLCLPFPISANRLWRKSRNRMHISQEYKAWKIEADGWYMQQKQDKTRVAGPFTYHVTLDERERAKAKDGDNRVKCLLDYLQRVERIDDDKFANGGTWAWGEADGCIITVEAA